MKEYSFNSQEFLGTKGNPAQMYGHSSEGLLYSPFSLVINEPERLMITGFKGDPEYSEIELQVFKDGPGEGAVVLLYHRNGKIDTYCSNLSNLYRDMYLLSADWEIIGETEIEFMLNISENGLDAYLKMTDKASRLIEFTIKENNQNKKFQNILAPLGALLNNPVLFPVPYLKNLAPIKYEGSEIKIVIDGKEMEPSVLPVKIDGVKAYHTRVTDDPCIGLWNKNFRGRLEPLKLDRIENNTFTCNGIKYTLVENAGHYEILQIACEGARHKMIFKFSPPVPDLRCLKEGSRIQGRFTGGVDENDGVMGGEYTVQRDTDNIRVKIDPTKGWQPVPGKLWLTTYSWQADIVIKKDEVTMESNWTRKKGRLHDFFNKL